MSFSDSLLVIPKKIIAKLENPHIPFHYYLITFLSALTLRIFAESFSQHSGNYLNINSAHLLLDFAHLYIGFTSGFLSLILLFYIVTQVTIEKIARVLLPCSLILLVTPLIDLITSLGQGHNILYLGFLSEKNPLITFLTFGNDYAGVSIGQKIEIMLAFYGICSYFIIKGRSVIASLFYTLIFYGIIFIYAAFPILIHAALNQLGFVYQPSSLQMIHFYLLLIFVAGTAIAYCAHSVFFIAIIKDFRWLRIAHYELMLALGATLALTQSPVPLLQVITQTQPTLAIHFILCAISIVFAGLFSIITNNISDQAIDRISNPTRPLVTNAIPLKTYQHISQAALVIALFYASIAGFKAFFIICVTLAAYYVYSMPPIRFKQVPVLSKLVISVNSIALLLLGYLLVNQTLIGFPTVLFPIFLIGFTLAINFIDIKDYEGDKQNGIVTLPGLLGLKTSKRLIGIAFFFTYLSFYFLLKQPATLALLFIGGCIQLYLVNKPIYNEKFILVFHLMSILLFIQLLLHPGVFIFLKAY